MTNWCTSPIDFVMGRTFCGHQFGNLLVSSLITVFIMNFNFVANKILATHLFGKDAMAGIEIVFPLLFITAFLEMMISMGTAYLYSFEVGAFKAEYANRLVGQGFLLTFILSAVLTTIFFFGENLYFSLYESAGAVTSFAREYYKPFLMTIAIHPLYVFMQRIVYADGGGKQCVLATTIQIFVHIASVVFMAINLGLGMVGVALGVFVSEIVALIIFLRWILFTSQTMRPKLHYSMSDAIHVLKLSYVSASSPLYFAVGNMLLVMYFLRTFHQEYFPILSAIISIYQLGYCFSGIEKAAEPIVNIYLGEENFDGVKKVMKLSIITSFLLGALAIPFFCTGVS